MFSGLPKAASAQEKKKKSRDVRTSRSPGQYRETTRIRPTQSVLRRIKRKKVVKAARKKRKRKLQSSNSQKRQNVR